MPKMAQISLKFEIPLPRASLGLGGTGGGEISTFMPVGTADKVGTYRVGDDKSDFGVMGGGEMVLGCKLDSEGTRLDGDQSCDASTWREGFVTNVVGCNDDIIGPGSTSP